MNRYFEKQSGKPLVFAEVPLLVQAGMEKDFDEIILVTCRDDTALERLINDRGYTREEALARLASQRDFIARQKEAATRILENNGSIRELDGAVGHLVRELS
jgi:dephospho-CoA kinase